MVYIDTPYHVTANENGNITIVDKFYKPVTNIHDIELFVEQANYFNKMKDALTDFFNDDRIKCHLEQEAYRKLYEAYENYC